MSTCADLRLDLAAHAQGEPVDGRASLEEHVATCATCAAELAALQSVVTLVRTETEIEPTTAETDALFAAIDAELAGAESSSESSEPESSEPELGPILEHPAWRRVWDRAVWRYENSDRFRRVTLASIGVHAAAAAAVAWLLIGGDRRFGEPELDVQYGSDVADLSEHDPLSDLVDEMGRKHRARPDEPLVAGEPQPFEAWSPAGAVLPEIFDRGNLGGSGERLRAPTVGILVRLRAVMDDETRDRRVSERVGAELGPRADAAVDEALAWLSERRADDGRWGPEPKGDAEDVRDGVTAAAVLAYVQNGRSARTGEFAELLAPAVDALERRLRDGAADGDTKPVYSQALAVRALTWQWALDYRHMGAEERAARRKLLAEAGNALVAWQDESGGFGYNVSSATAAGRPDASCTIFVTGALSDLRLAGVLRADETLRRAGDYLASVRGSSGIQGYRKPGDRDGDLALTAGVLAYARELQVPGDLRPLVAAVRDALTAPAEHDALLAWQGLQALRRHAGAAPALEGLLGRQRDDGSWPSSTDRHCRLGGDDLTTAMGVLAVTRVYMP